MNEITPSEKFLREWQKRMDAAKIEQEHKEKQEEERLRQEYMRRTGRTELKP